MHSKDKTFHCVGDNQDVDSTCSEEFFGKLYYIEWFRSVGATATIFVISILSIVSIITTPQTAVNKVVKWRQSYNPPNLTQYEYFDLVTTIHEPNGLCRSSSSENYKVQCMSKEPVFLLILVHSTPTHFRQRNEIRETWGNLTNLEACTNGSFRIRVIFLLGLPRVWKDQESTQIKINEESAQYKDILQCSLFDSYYNLTIKQITALKWVKELRPKVPYIFKCDDDVNVNVYNLINFIIKEAIFRPDDLLVGCEYPITKPMREPYWKWYCTYKMCPFEVYPKYLCGAGYLMSLKTMLKLYEAAQRLPLLPFEDVFITGLCAEEAKVEIRNNRHFYPFRTSVEICSYVNGIVTHHNIKLRDVYLSPAKTIQYLALCNTTNKLS